MSEEKVVYECSDCKIKFLCPPELDPKCPFCEKSLNEYKQREENQ